MSGSNLTINEQLRLVGSNVGGIAGQCLSDAADHIDHLEQKIDYLNDQNSELRYQLDESDQ